MFRYACADLLGVLRLLMFCVVRVRCCFWVPLFACLSSFLNTGVAYDQAKRGLHHHVDAASRFVLPTNEGMNLAFFMGVCVCVCVFSPSILVTVPPIKARRVLHFAAYSGDYTLQRIFMSF